MVEHAIPRESASSARLVSALSVALALVILSAAPAAGTVEEWEHEHNYWGIATPPDDEIRYAATGEEVHLLDASGDVTASFVLDASYVDVSGGRLLAGGADLSVTDLSGSVLAQVEWPGFPAPQISDVAISGSTAVVASNGGIRLFELDTLNPLGALLPADTQREIRLGAAGTTLLAAIYPLQSAPVPGYEETEVLVFEDLIQTGSVTLVHPQPESGIIASDLVPVDGGGIVVIHELRDPFLATLSLYDASGTFVEHVWSPAAEPRMSSGAIDVDACHGVVGAVTQLNSVALNHGFKYVSDDREGSCFLDTMDHRFGDAAAWLGEQGITKGCNPPLSDRFCPDRFVTRGEMAALLVRTAGYTDDGGRDFTDTRGHLFEGAIDRLSAAGLTNGCNPPANDRFCPGRFVTRGEMAAFLVRAFGYTDAGAGDHFRDDDNSVFEAAIDKLKVAGVTLGCNPPINDHYCPNDHVTRGQIAALLKRAMDR